MRTEERREGILHLLETGESVTVAELVEKLGASEATVRRDLVQLDQQGALRRTHGGARRLALRGVTTPFAARTGINTQGKRRIAAAAAGMLAHGESVVLDGGTTCLEMAHRITDPSLRVVPLSLRSATVLGDAGTQITMCGGDIRPDELSATGARALSSISAMRFDTAIMSCQGFTLSEGVTSYDGEDAAIKAAAVRYSGRVILLCDRTKWGRIAFGWVADTRDLATVVTDHVLTQDEWESVAELGLEVVMV
ncbi:DeoR/GlpR family DNA-binding transcription regulator [Kocuria sp. M4R2S49]|uniref:DeoR/GlpR family DNA-binding transcription regulator n=1 Tax=Kocuria rhizosphaericola TaxID=3376284 RepID=UPI003795B23C